MPDYSSPRFRPIPKHVIDFYLDLLPHLQQRGYQVQKEPILHHEYNYYTFSFAKQSLSFNATLTFYIMADADTTADLHAEAEGKAIFIELRNSFPITDNTQPILDYTDKFDRLQQALTNTKFALMLFFSDFTLYYNNNTLYFAERHLPPNIIKLPISIDDIISDPIAVAKRIVELNS